MSTSTPVFETLASGYDLVEAPRVGPEDQLYFSDPRGGGVYRRNPSGEIETLIPKRRGVGGIALHASGGIVVSGKNICHVRDGVSRIVFDLEDVPGFNDLMVDAHGSILVGSQRFNPFLRGTPSVPGELYRIHAEGKAEKLYDDVELTNGIGFSPDARRLYHSDSARNHVLVHDLGDQDQCKNRRVFAKLPRGAPDGLAVDEAGCVWVAAYGAGCIYRFEPNGSLAGQLDVPAKAVASLCFGGANRRDLYVATADNTHDPRLGGTLFRTRVETAGLPVPLARV